MRLTGGDHVIELHAQLRSSRGKKIVIHVGYDCQFEFGFQPAKRLAGVRKRLPVPQRVWQGLPLRFTSLKAQSLAEAFDNCLQYFAVGKVRARFCFSLEFPIKPQDLGIAELR